MIKMDLEVPEKAQMLLRKQYYYLDLFTQVEHMLTRNADLRYAHQSYYLRTSVVITEVTASNNGSNN